MVFRAGSVWAILVCYEGAAEFQKGSACEVLRGCNASDDSFDGAIRQQRFGKALCMRGVNEGNDIATAPGARELGAQGARLA